MLRSANLHPELVQDPGTPAYSDCVGIATPSVLGPDCVRMEVPSKAHWLRSAYLHPELVQDPGTLSNGHKAKSIRTQYPGPRAGIFPTSAAAKLDAQNKKIPDKVIMSYTGHKSLEIFNKYYKPNTEDKVDFMNSVWKLD